MVKSLRDKRGCNFNLEFAAESTSTECQFVWSQSFHA